MLQALSGGTSVSLLEQAVVCGAERNLAGILSLPEPHDPARVAVLMPNTGFEHRVGPNRLHVQLARAFATAGYAALRLDLSGMGDSEAAPGNVPDPVRDLCAAMEYLERMGIARRFVTVGLSTGAQDAHRLACADTRLAGAAFVDGYAYPTWRFRLLYLAQRLSDPHRFGNLLHRWQLQLARERAHSGTLEPQNIEFYRRPPLTETRRELDELMRRRLALCFVFTGEVQNQYNYADQLFDMYPGLRGYERADLLYMPHADHTFTRKDQRAELIQSLVYWVNRRLGPL